MSVFKINILFLFFFVLLIQTSKSQVVLGEENSILIGKSIQYLEDEDKMLTLLEVSSPDFQDKFIQSDVDILFFDYQNSKYWLKFSVKNNSDNSDFFLVIDYPLLYKISFFQPNVSGFDTLFAGDGFNFSKRSVKSATNVFHFSLKPNEQKIFYCSIESDGDVVSLPIYIYKPEAYIQKVQNDTILNGLFYGILFIIVIVNLFYFRILKEKSYLIYVLMIAFLAMFVGARDGYVFQYLFPSFPFLSNVSVSVFSMLSMLFILLMMISTLETKINFPVIHKITIGFSALVGVMIIPVFIPAYYRFFISFGNILGSIFILLAIVIMILALKKKLFFAKYFLIAISFLVLGSLFIILKNNGVVGIFQNEFLYKMATVLEVITLSYGLSIHFNNMLQKSKQEAIERLEQISKMKSEANEKLERLVKERTRKLDEINLILKEKNDELITTDEELRQNNEELIAQREHIEEQNQQFKELLINLEDIYVKSDFKGNFLNVSPSIVKEFNCNSLDEVYATNIFDWTVIDDETKKYFIRTLIKEKKIKNFAYKFKRLNSEDQFAELNASVFYKNGKMAGFEAIIRNITSHVKFEEELKNQKESVEIAHNKIKNSINYAKRIQDALLTSKTVLSKVFSEYFLVFNPKEQVSGDFYYVNKIKDFLIFAVADCTGHGVPGGFLTMLGITYLHEIIRRDEVGKPSTVLEILRERFKNTFKAVGSENQDGLDIALCVIDTKTNILQYSGAYNPLWIFRDGNLIEFKADRNPIGVYVDEKDFTNQQIELNKDDLIYIFSDGFQDQFGGEDYNKYTKKRFKDLLTKIQFKPLNEQKTELEKVFVDWKGNRNQIDDVTILGIKW